jgi:hypothetical protein
MTFRVTTSIPAEHAALRPRLKAVAETSVDLDYRDEAHLAKCLKEQLGTIEGLSVAKVPSGVAVRINEVNALFFTALA